MIEENSEKRVMLPQEIPSEDIDETIRPRRMQDFQGQQELKDNLELFIKAARQRSESLDHVFLNGPPGLGKTTLAGIIAAEMGAEIKFTSAPALDKVRDLAGILTTLAPHSVLFIDEIHRLKPALEEILYIAMEDRELDWIIGQGPSARTVRIPLPPFTLIGATTKAGSVSSPLLGRFGINIRLDLYSASDIALVLQRSAAIMAISVSATAIQQLSICSRGTPRVANRLLRRMRDYAAVLGDGIVNEAIVFEGMRRLGIDRLGLEELDRRLLRIIIEHYQGGPVGAETLSISLGESVDTLEDVYEPYLIQLGMIKRTSRGRMTTAHAWNHLGLSLPDKQASGTGGSNEDQGFLF